MKKHPALHTRLRQSGKQQQLTYHWTTAARRDLRKLLVHQPPAQGRLHRELWLVFGCRYRCVGYLCACTYVCAHTHLFFVNPGAFYSGGEGRWYADLYRVCSHSDPELTHLHCSDASLAQTSSFLLLNDVLMLETWPRLIWMAEAAPPMSYKRFCIRYGATSGFCSYKLLPNITSGTVFDKIRQNHIIFKRIKMFGFYFELNEELEC